jgi:hypothetical protein
MVGRFVTNEELERRFGGVEKCLVGNYWLTARLQCVYENKSWCDMKEHRRHPKN